MAEFEMDDVDLDLDLSNEEDTQEEAWEQLSKAEMKIYKADLGVEGMFRYIGFSEQ